MSAATAPHNTSVVTVSGRVQRTWAKTVTNGGSASPPSA